MASQECNIALFLMKSPKNINVEHRGKSRTTLDARVIEYLRYVVEISPAEYRCLTNAAHGIRCGKCPCRFADRLNGMLMLDIHNDRDGRRLPCTLTTLGSVNVEATEVIIAGLAKA
jgi:hypothetical protein